MKEKKSRFKSLLVATSVLGMVSYASAMGAGRTDIPLANYDIGNQATLTYQTLGGTNKLMQSNIVLTRINQTFALALDPDRTVDLTAGNAALFNHTLTNYGNGPDSFEITHNYVGRTIQMYLDANNNGVLDAGEVEIVPVSGKYAINNVDQWDSRSIIVRVSTTASETTQVNGTLTARSVGNNTITDTATETINFAAGANVQVYKALNTASGASDVAREVTVYLKVYNDSTTAGTNAVITDTLNTKFTYVDNSAKWQAYGTDTVTPISDSYNENGIVYSVAKKNPDGTGNDVVSFTVNNVPANKLIDAQGGVLSFKVLVKQKEVVGSIPNKATFEFNSGATTITGKESNTVTYSVLKYVQATFTGDTVATGQAGQEIRFVNPLTNTANAPEIYNLTIADKFFPVGTSFRLALQTPGQSERPILDNNGDGIVDTGSIAVNETVNVILYAQLPQSVSNLESNYTVKKVATSTYTPTYNVNAIDTLSTLVNPTVDLTNDSDLATNPNAPGKGFGPEQSPVTQVSVNPGATGNFVLYINNTSSYITDTFRLEVSTKPDFSDQVLPTGVGVKFKISGGVEVTTTSPIAPNNSMRVNAEVAIAPNTLAQTVPLYFRVTSTTTGAKDTKYDAITVNPIRNVSITPNNTGSTYAGGQVIYTHLVKNNGNVIEGDGVASNLYITLAETRTWAASDVFIDTDGNGAFDITIDRPLFDVATIGGLTPGQQITIFTRVVTQVGAPATDSNITTVTPSLTQGTYAVTATTTSATDTTTILAEDLTIIKGQKIGPGGTYVTNLQNANPGDTIYYRIVVQNTGSVDVKNVQIKDSIPYFTTIYNTGAAGAAGEGTTYKASYVITNAQGVTSAYKVAETQPASGGRGDVIANVGVLKPNETATLFFQVKIDSVPAKPASN